MRIVNYVLVLTNWLNITLHFNKHNVQLLTCELRLLHYSIFALTWALHYIFSVILVWFQQQLSTHNQHFVVIIVNIRL